MDPYTFLFDADHPHHGGLSDPILKAFYTALLSDKDSRLETFRFRTGLLSPHVAYRLSEIRTSEQPNPSEGTFSGEGFTYRGDTRLWVALLVDLADSAKETWCTFQPLRLPYHLVRHPTWVVSVSALKRATAEHIDKNLRQEASGYLGALMIDVGNPLQFDFLWHFQTEIHVYDSGHLGLLSSDPVHEDEFPLDAVYDWWSRLQFDSVFWLRRYDEFLVGEELVLSTPFDRNRMLPADLKREELSARGAASQILYETGAELTVVEKVASAVAEEMMGGKPGPSGLTISATRVPEAAKAFVQRRRLEGYILNPEHPKGKHKAQLFKDVLDLTSADWRYLADQLTQGLPVANVVNARLNPDGTMQFHVHIPVRGNNGRTVPVLSAWLIRPSSGPELITAQPSPRKVFISDADSFPGPRIIHGFDSSKDDECVQLYKIAHEAGLDASSLMIPRPIIFSDELIAEGEFGDAWVVVKDARRGFARWLIKEAKAKTLYGHPGAWMPVAYGYPHVQRAEAYAQAFAEVLEVNDVRARVKTLLD